ncbi:MAG: restriction endonuclease subunit S [Bacteroidota bacterium]
MKKYLKYKPSGVEWIDSDASTSSVLGIPEHWEVTKTKYLFVYHSGNGFPESLQGQTEGDVPFFKVSDINKEESFVSNSNNYVNYNDVKANRWNIIPQYSILAAKIGEALRKNHRKINTVECLIDNNCIALTPKDFEVKFAYYLLVLINFDWFTNPGAVPSISIEKLKNSYVLNPPLFEQTAIANYLDDKNAKIDTLIEKKKKLIELLKEERTVIINDAVTGKALPLTKGEKQRGFKPSGIESLPTGKAGLGKIPEQWEVKKLKYVAKLRDELIDDTDFKIAVENIDSGTGKLVNIEEDKSYQGKLSAFKVGDTIFNKLRPYLHKVYFAEKDGGLFGELLIVYSFGELIPKLIFYKLFSKIFIDIVDGSTQGTKMPRANWNDFINQLFISFPKNKEEQHQIVQHIETETERIDGTISKIEKEIELLAEYRIALISEVVTGKIKVIDN